MPIQLLSSGVIGILVSQVARSPSTHFPASSSNQPPLTFNNTKPDHIAAADHGTTTGNSHHCPRGVFSLADPGTMTGDSQHCPRDVCATTDSGITTGDFHHDRRDICAAVDLRAEFWQFLTTALETYAPPLTFGLKSGSFSPRPSGHVRRRRPSGSSLVILTTTLKYIRRGSPFGLRSGHFHHDLGAYAPPQTFGLMPFNSHHDLGTYAPP